MGGRSGRVCERGKAARERFDVCEAAAGVVGLLPAGLSRVRCVELLEEPIAESSEAGLPGVRVYERIGISKFIGSSRHLFA